MTEIPKTVEILLPKLQRSALKSLLDAAPPGYQLSELLELVLIRGLSAVLHGRELPAMQQLEEKARASVPVGNTVVPKHTRIANDFLGFSIEPHQQAALADLEARHPLVDDEELCRILLDCALRALPMDDLAQRCLESATSPAVEGGQ